MLLLYDLLALISMTVVIPFLVWQRFYQGKYRGFFAAKLGLSMPRIKEDQRQLIWVHAVSLGEFKAVSYLLHIWRKELPQLRFFVTHGTLTGYKQAELEFGRNFEHAMMPLDLPFNRARFFRALRPAAIIFVEHDLWPGFLLSAQARAIPSYLISGALSERSSHRMRSLGSLAQKLFWDPLTLACMQTKVDFSRAQQLGATSCLVTGNIKWDHPYPTPDSLKLESLRQRLGLSHEARLVVAASTHQGEEAMLLKALEKPIREGKLQLALVPRHPERFSKVSSFVESMGFRTFCYSAALEKEQEEKKHAQVIVIDAMGILMECYALSQVALVGGSWVNIGGHNILEPLTLGVPTLYGPYMQAQHEMDTMAQKYNAAKKCSVDQVAELTEIYLGDQRLSQEIRVNAARMLKSFSGAVTRTDEALRASWKEKGLL